MGEYTAGFSGYASLVVLDFTHISPASSPRASQGATPRSRYWRKAS